MRIAIYARVSTDDKNQDPEKSSGNGATALDMSLWPST
jgi:hypothetical protein